MNLDKCRIEAKFQGITREFNVPLNQSISGASRAISWKEMLVEPQAVKLCKHPGDVLWSLLYSKLIYSGFEKLLINVAFHSYNCIMD